MRDPFAHIREDLGNIAEWLEWKRGARTMQVTAPAPMTIPPPADAPPERVLPEPTPAADPAPEPAPVTVPASAGVVCNKDEPKKVESCAHCDGPMPGIRSAAARYCSEVCKRAARRRLDRLQPCFPDP
jgi:hypothetical protein